jgi:hypothetical protein
VLARGAARRLEAVALAAPFWQDREIVALLGELAGAGIVVAALRPPEERPAAAAGTRPAAAAGTRPAAEAGRRAAAAAGALAAISAADVGELSAALWSLGIRPSEGAVLLDASSVTPGAAGAAEPRGGEGPAILTATPATVRAVLKDQLRRRGRGDLPEPPAETAAEPTPESPWTVVVKGVDPALEPLRDVRLSIIGAVAGTLGSPMVEYPPARRGVFVTGVYEGEGAESRLLVIPDWMGLAGRLDEGATSRRILDLRTGLLHHDVATELGRVRAVSFASRARPGVGVLRARGEGAVESRRSASGRDGPGNEGRGRGGPATATYRGATGGAVVATSSAASGRGEERRLDRVCALRANWRRVPPERLARADLARAEAIGFDRLLAEQRRAWAARWADMDIAIEGDPDMQRAVRYALFQLAAHGADGGESAIGARGVSGPKYRGHVFWDTDVYVLPFLAATYPRAARAVLEYRARRLEAARDAARQAGLEGARMPWESAADGREVTPTEIPRPGEAPLPVLTGRYELHITADVAWAAGTYADWTADEAFARGPGAALLFETARYWASRIEEGPDGRAHISNVIGPDEYHNLVTDNAYTNVMARWNLRRAAAWEAGAGRTGGGRGGTGAGDPRLSAPSDAERRRWLDLAGRLVDGFDSRSRLYEQFAGYFGLQPVAIAELAKRPLSGEVFLGRDRVAATQCVKQPDVLMLYQLVPEELVPGTLEANLDFYDRRTSHGSSLSPGIHASLLARAGRTEEALEALRMIAFIDLDDASRGTAEGLHMAALGSIWQAMAFGFAGIRLSAGGLAVDPHLPASWRSLEVPVRLRGGRVRVRVEPDRLRVWAERPIPVLIPGLEPVVAGRGGITAVRRGDGWTRHGGQGGRQVHTLRS